MPEDAIGPWQGILLLNHVSVRRAVPAGMGLHADLSLEFRLVLYAPKELDGEGGDRSPRDSAVTSTVLSLLLAVSAFPIGDEWVLVDDKGIEQSRLSEVGGLRPLTLEVLPGGRYVATAVLPGDADPSLWLITPQARKRLGYPSGAHLFPTVTNDGQWVYFSYHPDPRLMAPGREYTQLWRTRLDGSGLSQLTSSVGCKLSPSVVGATVFYAHARCGEQMQGLDRLDGVTEKEALAPTEDFPVEPRLSPDGAWLAFGVLRAREVEVRVAPAKRPERSRLVWSASRFGSSLHLKWIGATELMFVHRGELRKVSAMEKAARRTP